MKKYLWLVILMLCAGCITTGGGGETLTITDVDRTDGVSRQEAFAIGKDSLAKSEYKSDYRANKASVHSDILTQDYPDYWFLVYPPTDFQRGFWSYLSVVHRDTGEIIFEGPFVPLRVKSYDWIFDKEEARRLWGY